MKRFVVVIAAAAAAILYGSANANAAMLSNESDPIDQLAFVGCAAGGTGEDVQLTGQVHFTFAVTDDGAGGFHVESSANPQGVRGVGLTTGATYQGTGVTRSTFNAKAGVQSTFVNNFRLIGTAGAPSFTVHEVAVFVVNANGVVTASFDKLSVTCG